MKKEKSKITPKKDESKQIHIRLNVGVLKTVDSYCKAHGIVRNQYLVEAVIRRLNSDLKK